MRHTLIFIAWLSGCLLAFGQAKPAQQSPAKSQASPQAQPSAQTQASDAAMEAKLTQTATATINWDKSTTAGAKAEVQLIKKDQANGKPLIQYRLKITGAPRNKLYNLIAWPIMMAEPATIMEGLAIAADGTVGCPPNSDRSCAQRFKGAELKLTYTPAIGEIFRHALISEDHQTRIFFSIVPAPMVENDKSCSMEVVRLSPRFELALIRGRGFTPGEQLSFHTQSYQEAHDSQPKVDPNGEFWAVLTPFVKGRTIGTVEVSARGKSCAPALSFQWGSE
ncbi:MAG TPA: hypothetical protein VKL99_04750 [Candidatus Angelobacter sp.]|nr:hypothetical protein [Candidatus Angelobacter sp.]